MKIYLNLIENANRVLNVSSTANHRRFVVNIRYANLGKLKYFENDLKHIEKVSHIPKQKKKFKKMC